MGVMCLVWRSRLVVSMILVVVLCGVYASDAQPIVKVYPRGNHWAVGHLMGKKSTDEQVRPEESEFMTTPDQDLQLERFNKHLYALMTGRTGAERMQDGTEGIDASKLLQRMLTKRRQWEEDHERDRQVKLLEDFLLKALRIQDDIQS
ncbi:gastrin-releasing peptide-like [Pimephales promelas]|uniref:gastrin-releasing peptide-like n=1 Tax=Pimephales promelas TaxID=90988 RepID=UPI0019555C14|nr:gastrin-releasing peptide-like [Pimephales promelas]KAG1943645.1 gastrin-releasing peptide [Pimephales promelas]